MICLVQRVEEAEVKCSSGKTENVKKGVLVYVGFEEGDNENLLEICARKILNLRIFEDERGKMNLSVKDIGGEILLIPNFTLAGDAKKGNRPSFDRALKSEIAITLFEKLAKILSLENPTKTGVFRDRMVIFSKNDGPVNIVLSIK